MFVEFVLAFVVVWAVVAAGLAFALGRGIRVADSHEPREIRDRRDRSRKLTASRRPV